MSTKILVTSEIASGLVNGVNKTYSVSKSISSISLVLVNGSEYAQYSFSGTTIIMDDAPSSGQIQVTYSYESNYDYLDNTGWIAGEIMSGIVNSSNKVFTSFYQISYIDEVRVNGVPVVGYSVSGNNILLASAPTTGLVEIDYFRKDLTISDLSGDKYYTKKEVRDLVYADIGQDETSVQYPKSLVDMAILDGVSEAEITMVDKSKFVSFSIDNPGYIEVTPVTNSITSVSYSSSKKIPPKGRISSYENLGDIEYSSITSSGVMNTTIISGSISSSEKFYIGYKLPRNIKRIVSVTYDKGLLSVSAGSLSDFMYSSYGYYVNNGYIYLKYNSLYTIEVELNEYVSSSDDNSIIFIDKDDIGIVVYYALRQLYASRESDKLNSVSQLYIDKSKSYKKKIRQKRGINKTGRIKTLSLITK